MAIDSLMTSKTLVKRPRRLQRHAKLPAGAVYVGPGSKWANPIRRLDVESLVSSEADIAEACERGGWKAGAVQLYRDYLLEENLDPSELLGKDLVCTCKLSDPCHADVLIELANQ
jgi:Domain of unknown function (DUF4326)